MRNIVVLIVFLVFLLISPNLLWNLGFSLIHLINLFLFIFWIQLLVSLLGTKFSDIFQLLPVITNLLFLLSPILYEKKNLAAFSFTADFNPVFQVLRLLRDSIIYGNSNMKFGFIVFCGNVFFIVISLLIYKRMEKKIIYYI